MKKSIVLLSFAIGLVACTSDDATGIDASPESSTKETGTTQDTGVKDTGVQQDTGAQDSGVQDSGAQDSAMKDASDAAIQEGGIADSGPDVQDAGFSLNGCTDNSFVDVSNGNQSARTVDWDLAQNFPYCFTIAQNQSFVWNTTGMLTFASHPLEPAGGDQNNPIALTNGGTTVSFQFKNTGNYGFDCQFHPGIMRGVIRVK